MNKRTREIAFDIIQAYLDLNKGHIRIMIKVSNSKIIADMDAPFDYYYYFCYCQILKFINYENYSIRRY